MEQMTNGTLAEEQKGNSATGDGQAHIFFEQNIDFESNAETKYLSSNKFLQNVSNVMHSVYADFEGCKLVPMKDGSCYIIFYFNHGKYDPSDDKIIACTPIAPNVSATNETLRSIRLADSYRSNGEKYYLTEEGKSSIMDLLIRGNLTFHENGKVKWDKILFEAADPNPQYAYYNRQMQMLTSVSYIDPCTIAALMYGDGSSKESPNPKWEYVVRCHNSLIPNRYGQVISSGLMLSIDRISIEETQKLAMELGIQQAPGLDIIR